MDFLKTLEIFEVHRAVKSFVLNLFCIHRPKES